jgi:hypothetical protein
VKTRNPVSAALLGLKATLAHIATMKRQLKKGADAPLFSTFCSFFCQTSVNHYTKENILRSHGPFVQNYKWNQ